MDVVYLLVVAVGIFHIPLLVDLINSFAPGSLKRVVNRWFVYLLRVLIISLNIVVFTLYFKFWAWLFIEDENALFFSFRGALMTGLAVWLFIGANFHYISACFLHPGRLVHPEGATDQSFETCDKCKRDRPVGSRHCSACGTCVFYMDHHCPFTGNCCAFDNYINFHMWLAYTCIGLVYAVTVSIPPFFVCTLGVMDPNVLPPHIDCPQIGSHALLFIPLVSILALMGSLFIFETTLVLINRSTVNWCLARLGSHSSLAQTSYPAIYGRTTKFNFLFTRGRSPLGLLNPCFRHHPTEYKWRGFR